MHIRLSFGQLSSCFPSPHMSCCFRNNDERNFSSWTWLVPSRLDSAQLSSGAAVPLPRGPNETRLINELLISFATTRRHIHIMLSFASHVPTSRSRCPFPFPLLEQTAAATICAPWQLQHNNIMSVFQGGAGSGAKVLCLLL